MEVFKNYVIVEQKMTKKSSKIIDISKKDEDKFDYQLKIIKVGPSCGEHLTVGIIPLFRKHIQFEVVKVIEESAESKLLHLIVNEEDIVGKDETN